MQNENTAAVPKMIVRLIIVRQRVCLLLITSANQQCEYQYSYVRDENTHNVRWFLPYTEVLVHEYEMNISSDVNTVGEVSSSYGEVIVIRLPMRCLSSVFKPITSQYVNVRQLRYKNECKIGANSFYGQRVDHRLYSRPR